VRKQDVAGAYRDLVGGPWADYVAAVDRVDRAEHAYLVPEDPAARRRLRALCAAADYENHFLAAYRA
jgi:hypothetical protein